MKNTIFALLLSVSLFADEIVTTKDGKTVLLKDNFTWEYVLSSKITNIKYSEDAVTIWDKELLRKDGEYYKVVGVFLHYQNNTDKKVTGIVVKIDVVNPFGKSVLSTTYEDQVVLEANEKLKNDEYWVYKDNQFIDDEPYDKMWQMADNGTAKINTKIMKVIFADGTILTPKPMASKPPVKK